MNLIRTCAWIIRHPLFAAHWYLTGEPWSATLQELHELACRTRDPSTLSDEIIAEMKAAQVGPWQHSLAEWQEAFDKALECDDGARPLDQSGLIRLKPAQRIFGRPDDGKTHSIDPK